MELRVWFGRIAEQRQDNYLKRKGLLTRSRRNEREIEGFAGCGVRRPDVEQRRGTDTCVRERTESAAAGAADAGGATAGGHGEPDRTRSGAGSDRSERYDRKPGAAAGSAAEADGAAVSAGHGKDYTEPNPFFPNPLKDYTPTNYPAPRLGNTPGLRELLRDGKIYLSLAMR